MTKNEKENANLILCRRDLVPINIKNKRIAKKKVAVYLSKEGKQAKALSNCDACEHNNDQNALKGRIAALKPCLELPAIYLDLTCTQQRKIIAGTTDPTNSLVLLRSWILEKNLLLSFYENSIIFN